MEKQTDKLNREEKFEALQEQLETIADSYVADPEKIAEYLQFASKFYRYSPTNTMLIQAQNSAATFIASFQAWRSQGYSVRRGETGMKIFVPVTVTFFKDSKGDVKQISQATAQEKKMIQDKKFESWTKLRFKIGTVFDIVQTNVPFADYPKILTPGVASEEHAAITERLTSYIEANVCDVKTQMSDGATILGSYDRHLNLIQLSPAQEDTALLSTLAHELGHAIMHQEKPDLSVAEKEFQADAFSIMLHQELGLDITDDTKAHLAYVFNEMKRDIERRAIKEAPEDVDKKEYVKLSQRRVMIFSLKEVHATYNAHIPSIIKAIKEPSIERAPEIEYERTK